MTQKKNQINHKVDTEEKTDRQRVEEQEHGQAWPGSLLDQRAPVLPVHLLKRRLLIPTAGAGVEGCRRKRVSTSIPGW